MLGARKNRDYAPFGEGFVQQGQQQQGQQQQQQGQQQQLGQGHASEGGAAASTEPAAAAGGGGGRGGDDSSTSGGRASFSTAAAAGATGGGGGGMGMGGTSTWGGGRRGSLPLTVGAAAAGKPPPTVRVGGGSWVLPPEPPRRRLREALCCLRMSPVQTIFLLGLISCLAFLSIDAWSRRRVLRLLFLTLEDVRPHTAGLLTVSFGGMGLVFVALGFPTTLLAVLGGHVYGRLLGGSLGVLVASIVTTVAAGLGCLCSFLLTKGMLRDCASEWLHTRAALEGLDTALRLQGLKVNLLLRLCPLVPYNVMNLLMGLTATRVEDYAIGCFVGMLPTAILLSYFGAGLDTLEGIGDFPSSHPTEMRIIYGTGAGVLLLTLALLYRSTRHAMRDAVKRKQSLVDSIGWEM